MELSLVCKSAAPMSWVPVVVVVVVEALSGIADEGLDEGTTEVPDKGTDGVLDGGTDGAVNEGLTDVTDEDIAEDTVEGAGVVIVEALSFWKLISPKRRLNLAGKAGFNPGVDEIAREMIGVAVGEGVEVKGVGFVAAPIMGGLAWSLEVSIRRRPRLRNIDYQAVFFSSILMHRQLRSTMNLDTRINIFQG